MENEIWRDIPGYEGYYQASNLGRVRSLDRFIYHKNGHYQKSVGKILICVPNKIGYCQVFLCKNNEKKKHFYVHRLVWTTFYGEIPDDMEVNHKDENKQNNSLDNLNLLSHKDNNNWGNKPKKMSDAQKKVKILQFDTDNNFIKEWDSAYEIERELGFNQRNIRTCCAGKNSEGRNIKTAYGFKWKFKEKRPA